jgi:mono/diheme cytochrome c family protein
MKALVAVLALTPAAGALAEEAAPETLRLGQELYAANCASCHGAKLEGQPDWKRRLPTGRMPAPPHDETGHTWHHADSDLFRLTKEGVAAVVGGGYQSDMPAFAEALSDDEIGAILAYIKSAWPERARQFQAEVTRNSGEAAP